MDKKQTLIGRLVWTGRKSIGVGLLLVVVLVGMLLLNPAAFGSQIDEESQQTFADGTILKHRFLGNPDTGRLRAVLRLESFRGQTGKEHDASILYVIRLTAIEPDATCDSNAFWGRPRNQATINRITRDDPWPARISDVDADSHDSGKRLCYYVGLGFNYYYSTGIVPEIKAKSIPERPALAFGQQIKSLRRFPGTDDYYIQLSLSLKPSHHYPGRLPSRTAMIVQWEIVEQKSGCQAAAFTSAPNPNLREDDHHKMKHVNQVSSDPLWYTDHSIVLGATSQFACWRVWVDPERDNQNWQAYYYAGPRLPRVWSTAGPALAGEENTTFKFSLVDETEDSYRIQLEFAEYGGLTGRLAQPLKYTLKAKPVDRQSDCSAKNFVKPGESLDYIEEAGDIDRVSNYLIYRPLPDPNTYSQKFICFRVVITPDNAGWYQISLGQYQTYYYASERLPKMSGPAFSHRIKTKTGYYPEITLRLQSLGEKTNSSANITSIRIIRVNQAEGCRNAGGEEILDTPISVRPPVDLATITLDSIYDGKFICLKIKIDGTYHQYAAERIELDLPDLPDEWTIEEAVRLLKRQLTDEGLQVLQEVEFIASPNGCYPTYEGQLDGCWAKHEQKIYIHDGYFPEDYATRSQGIKLNIMKNTLHVLAHETNHAIETYIKGLVALVFDCYDAITPPSNLPDQIKSWYTNQRFNYIERLGASNVAEACLLGDSTWGEVIKALKTERDRHDWVDDWVATVRHTEVFSTIWFREFYAELPTRAPALSTVLENHYDLYYKDRSKLADVLKDRRPWFD